MIYQIIIKQRKEIMKLNLAVLFGGKSVEHEISVISALQALKAFDQDKYNLLPIFISKNNEFYFGEALKNIENYRNLPKLLAQCKPVRLERKGDKTYLMPSDEKVFGKMKPIAAIDVAFPIVHGTNVEDGNLQGFLHTLGLPFVGCDVFASAVCMDKFATKMILASTDVPVLPCLKFANKDFENRAAVIKKIETQFAYPMIVKPINLGSSVGISKVANQAELTEAIDVALQFAEFFLVETAVTDLKEINCSVLGDSKEVLASECEEPVSSDKILSYTDKYVAGGKASKSAGMASLKRKIPADIAPELRQKVQTFAKTAFQALGCSGVARLDFLYDQTSGELWLNEVNTIPGSLSFYLWEATGMKYSELLDRLVDLSLKRQRQAELLNFSFDTNIFALGQFSAGNKGAKKI